MDPEAGLEPAPSRSEPNALPLSYTEFVCPMLVLFLDQAS